VTTGTRNCVVWAGIHQKTSPTGGQQHHGWPDAGYVERLQHECAAVGVFSDEQEEEMRRIAVNDRMVERWSTTATSSERGATGSMTGSHDAVTPTPTPTMPAGAPDAPVGANDTEWVLINVESECVPDAAMDLKLEAEVVAISKAIKQAMTSRDATKVRVLMAAANLANARVGGAGNRGGTLPVVPNLVAATSA
jgi:hypothetical protein